MTVYSSLPLSLPLSLSPSPSLSLSPPPAPSHTRYPGRGGAFRYVVYAAPVGQALSEQRLSRSNVSRSTGTAGGTGTGTGTGKGGPQWQKMYEGAENVCSLEGLTAGTVYQVKVYTERVTCLY